MTSEQTWLRDDLSALVGGEDVFAYFSNLEGEVFRVLESRRTFATELGGKRYFVKYHLGTPTAEVLKNLLRFRLPVVSARNERDALRRLGELGVRVPRIAAWGIRGLLPQTCESFIVTEDVGTQYNLEDHTRDWSARPPAFPEKIALLKQVADVSALMHNHGICHRDLYICHFLVSGETEKQLTLIDLHRALVKPGLGKRWVVKDIGSLYFSAMEIGLTGRDLLRFIRWYSGKSLKQVLAEDQGFWLQVKQRGEKLKRRHG